MMHLLEYFELTEHPYRDRDSSNDMIAWIKSVIYVNRLPLPRDL